VVPIEWLRSQLCTAWWRRLPDRHFRLVLNLLALAAEDPNTAQVGGDSDRQVATHSGYRVVTRMADIVALCGASRSTVRRMLLELEQRGLLKLSMKSGRGSPILVILGQFSGENVDSFFSPETGENSDVCRSGVPPDPGKVGQFSESVQGKLIPLFPSPRARADLDLLRSSDPDLRSDPLRSSTPRDLNKSLLGLDSFPPAAEWPVGHRDEDVDQPAKPRATAVDTAQIQERAWAAADYLRAQVIQRFPACLLGRKAWECGWTWQPGKQGERTGDGSRSGLRLGWAREFHQLHGKLLAALTAAAPVTTSDDAWTEISRTVHWLFHGQTTTGFRVDSPGSLITKWDRIQDTRQGQAKRAPRGANGQPDPRARREIKTWTGDE